ncbi:MAG: nucleoside triphosphate pyrophosphohydrolase [Uliginosibacterium sp.]|nr:nucleoside triphosphate pyrophosphohydrolase [Uliginosibacterium sp.]
MREVQQFNKLVRNGIPSKISNGGEIVWVSHLDGDNYLHALKEKLVEEAVEVLDAFGHDRILEELADVEEVVDAILAKLGATKKQLLAVQKRKRAAVGGFEDGVVLLETKNPSVQQNSAEDLFREIDAPSAGGIVQTSQSQREAIIRRWGDKREYLDGTQQRILKFSVGLAQDSWFTDTRELMVDEKVGASVRAKITGKRKGSSIDIEVSVYALAIQGKLFDS